MVKFNDNPCGFTAGLRAQKSAAENPNPAVGTAKGESTSVLSTLLPGNWRRTMNQARGSPKMRSTAVTVRATLKESPIADKI